MNLASLVVRAQPAKMAVLRDALLAIPGAEIHAETEDGRMIVTVEETPEQTVSTALTRVQQLEPVICVTLAYEHSERATEEAPAAASAPADAGGASPESVRKFQEA
ncbi:chaperone NapD [Oryzomicrobium sp.]|uniref:chaperone NapD n=1 Tax=Oryzomicrobium sp. TaxID=1911578 RepID=UPI0025E1B3A0|nr:chaperone NapD [Oryzomicrobium sp.]MCE1242005.1 chaperone NapD [Oryzomicrobium sp.]